jgi:hypothetical protein
MTITSAQIDRALEQLLEVALRTPAVGGEYEASRREFFRTPPQAVLPRAALSAEARLASRRHLEWFLLERPCNALDGVPVESVLARVDELGPDDIEEEALRALLSSTCGVFEVTGVSVGEGAWVKDLGALGEYPLHEPEGSHAFEIGDVLVGRLFGIGDALHRLSPAAGFFRSEKLHQALIDDLARAREQRRGVLRLSQLEIEAMFWPSVVEPAVDPVEVARAFLGESGFDETTIDGIFEELALTPFDPTLTVYGLDDALAAILERLAFETTVDLDGARRVLILAWPRLAAPEVAPELRGLGLAADAVEPTTEDEQAEVEPPQSLARAQRAGRSSRDVRSAIEAFDRGRSAGRDLDELFKELERELELDEEERAARGGSDEEAESEDEDSDGATADESAPATAEALAPDFPGVVGAMVEEFLWETNSQGGALLRLFAEFGADIGVFENVGAHQLLVFTTIWLPERGALQTPDDVRRMLDVLQAFCAWCEEVHDVPLLAAFRSVLGGIDVALARIAHANRARSDERDLQRGEMFEVVALGRAQVTVCDSRGNVHDARLDARIAEHLLVGDRLRATRSAQGALEVHCCYPAEVARLEPQGRRAAGT